MFREMRLKEQQLTQREAAEILKNGAYGVLALCGDGGFPYAVPINYVYDGGVIYFHGTAEGGHKLDSIKKCAQASFCVVEKADLAPEEFNTLFVSAIAFGRTEPITDAAEKRKVLELILQKYSADFMESGRNYVDASWDDVCAVKLVIEHLTAKKGV